MQRFSSAFVCILLASTVQVAHNPLPIQRIVSIKLCATMCNMCCCTVRTERKLLLEHHRTISLFGDPHSMIPCGTGNGSHKLLNMPVRLGPLHSKSVQKSDLLACRQILAVKHARLACSLSMIRHNLHIRHSKL